MLLSLLLFWMQHFESGVLCYHGYKPACARQAPLWEGLCMQGCSVAERKKEGPGSCAHSNFLVQKSPSPDYSFNAKWQVKGNTQINMAAKLILHKNFNGNSQLLYVLISPGTWEIKSLSLSITWVPLCIQIWLTYTVHIFSVCLLWAGYVGITLLSWWGMWPLFSWVAVGEYDARCLACLSNGYLEGVIFCPSPLNSAGTPHPHLHQQPWPFPSRISLCLLPQRHSPLQLVMLPQN